MSRREYVERCSYCREIVSEQDDFGTWHSFTCRCEREGDAFERSGDFPPPVTYPERYGFDIEEVTDEHDRRLWMVTRTRPNRAPEVFGEFDDETDARDALADVIESYLASLAAEAGERKFGA